MPSLFGHYVHALLQYFIIKAAKRDSDARVTPTSITTSSSAQPPSKVTDHSAPTLPSIPEEEQERNFSPPGLQVTIQDTGATATTTTTDDDDKMDVDAEWDISLYWSLFTRREVDSGANTMGVEVVGLLCNETPTIEDIEMIDVTS